MKEKLLSADAELLSVYNTIAKLPASRDISVALTKIDEARLWLLKQRLALGE